MNNHAKKAMINLITIIISLVIIYILYARIGCPLRRITGIKCPGCGMIHAIGALAKLNLHKAVEYHPFVILIPVYAALFINRYNQTKKFNIALAVSFFVILVAIYICRLAMIV